MRVDAKRDFRMRAHAEPVVEIKHHGRTFRGRNQQVFKFAQSVRTDGVALVAGQQITVGAFVDKHIEVVDPEVSHHFIELALTIDRAHQLGLHQFIDDNLLRILERQNRFFLFCGHAIHEGVGLGAFGGRGESAAIFG